MQALTNRSKVVVNKKMTFMESIYLPAIFSGMMITIKHLFKKKLPYNILSKHENSVASIVDSTF